MKKFLRILKGISWSLFIGGPVVALLWSKISPDTASDSTGNSSTPFILIVSGLMLLGLVGLILTYGNNKRTKHRPCTVCKGLKEIPSGAWSSVYYDNGITCPHCNGTGEEPEASVEVKEEKPTSRPSDSADSDIEGLW